MVKPILLSYYDHVSGSTFYLKNFGNYFIEIQFLTRKIKKLWYMSVKCDLVL